MDALDSVLADLVDADRDCAYVTIKREPLEALIYEWARRGDQMAPLSSLLTRARNQLAGRTAPFTAYATHRAKQLCGLSIQPLQNPPRPLPATATCSAGACRTTQAGFAFGDRRRWHARH